ncbi:MAG: ABC transporter substrate-binding protein [Bradymonadia bacterium]
MSTRRSMLLVSALFLLAGGACNKDPDPKAETLVISISSDSTIFNPFSPSFSRIGQHVTGRLMRVDSSGQSHPSIAQSILPEPGSHHWIIELNPQAQFFSSAGADPVTVEDVISSITAYANPKTGSTYAGALESGGYAGVERIDERYVRVKFDRAWAPAPSYLGALGVWPTKLVTGLVAEPDLKVPALELVGAGPYRIVEYQAKDHAVLEPTGEGVAYRFEVMEPTAAATAMRRGEIDLVYAEPNLQAAYRKMPGVTLMGYDYHEVISLSCRAGATPAEPKRQKLCEALFLSVDAEAMRTAVAEVGSAPAKGRLFAEQDAAFNAPDAESIVPGFSPEKAKQALDAAGYAVGPDGQRRKPDGSPLIVGIVTYSSISEYPSLASRLKYDLERLLKVSVDARVVDYSQYIEVVSGRRADVDWTLLIAEWPFHKVFDPTLAESIASSSNPTKGSGRNYVGVQDPQIDALVSAADAELEQGRRAKLFANIHRRLLAERWVKPLYFARDAWIVSERVTGYDPADTNFKHTLEQFPERLHLKSR